LAQDKDAMPSLVRPECCLALQRPDLLDLDAGIGAFSSDQMHVWMGAPLDLEARTALTTGSLFLVRAVHSLGKQACQKGFPDLARA